MVSIITGSVVNISKDSVWLFHSTNHRINPVKNLHGEHPSEFLRYTLNTTNFHLTNN